MADRQAVLCFDHPFLFQFSSVHVPPMAELQVLAHRSIVYHAAVTIFTGHLECNRRSTDNTGQRSVVDDGEWQLKM